MKKLNLLLAVAALSSAIPAHATIIELGLNVGYLVNPPANVRPGMLTSNQFAFLFREQKNFTLKAPLVVDIATTGDYTTKPTTTSLIPAGTVINSYYVHANSTSKVIFNAQVVGFSSEETIIGLMVNYQTIQAADPILGSPTTLYDTTDQGIGLHFPPVAKDSMNLQPVSPATNNTMITFTEGLSARSITDFRIITTIVPNGATSGLK